MLRLPHVLYRGYHIMQVMGVFADDGLLPGRLEHSLFLYY